MEPIVAQTVGTGSTSSGERASRADGMAASSASRIRRRTFLQRGAKLGLGCCFAAGSPVAALGQAAVGPADGNRVRFLNRGERQLLVDDLTIAQQTGVRPMAHAARKLPGPVLEGDRPWEHVVWDGVRLSYASIYGTVLRDERTGSFRMWYNCGTQTLYATSRDGIHWEKPDLGQAGATNIVGLFDFHSPSFVLDRHEPDPARRYKAIGSKGGYPREVMARLAAKFGSPAWYRRSHAYAAAYSADGLKWSLYPEPALLGMDTITLAEDPATGEFLTFHKNSQDPRSIGRQIFLATSRDLQSWSRPELVLATDELDHAEAWKLERGTHAEFYNMSAFAYANQWLGLATRFLCRGEPLVGGRARPGQDGVIDVVLVHSRDGRKWQRFADRSPVIPVGPKEYDAGMILGVSNTPVIVGDEMWFYYSAATRAHASRSPEQKNTIARAVWRRDGLASLHAGEREGLVETVPFEAAGETLVVNADVAKGQLLVSVADANGRALPGYGPVDCVPLRGAAVRQPVRWRGRDYFPRGNPVRLRFHLTKGDLYSYTIE